MYGRGYNLSPALDVEDGLTGSYKGDSGSSVSLTTWCNEWYQDVSNSAASMGIDLQQVTYINAGASCFLDVSPAIGGYGWVAWTNCCWPYNSGEEQTGTPWCEDTGCEIYGSGTWTIWQWAWPGEGQAILNGLKEHVDQDVYNGTLSQMIAAMGTTGTAPAFTQKPTNTVVLAGSSLVIPATVFASPPAGYYWTNVTSGATVASGTTNGVTLNGTVNATLTVNNVPLSWNNNTLQLTVTNAWGATNVSITVTAEQSVLAMTNLPDGQTQLSWTYGGTLESATNLNGPLSTVTSISPYVVPLTNAQMFFKVVQ